MRLVTFSVGNGPQRAGALIDGDSRVLDLQAAYGRLYHGSGSPLPASVLAMVEAGEAAFDVAQQLLTLHPGEFFGSGTVGNGCGLEHMRFLKPGDAVELEVEGIGVLRNRVVK